MTNISGGSRMFFLASRSPNDSLMALLYNVSTMPELPEVETVRAGLSQFVVGKKVAAATHDWDKSFPNAKADVRAFLIGASVTAVRRRAKILLIDLSSQHS